MKNTQLHIKWKRLQAIPKKQYFAWTALAILFFVFLFRLLLPEDAWVKRTEVAELTVENASIHLTTGKARRYQLEIESGGEIYHLTYPRGTYREQYEAQVRADLLSGQTTTVTARILNNSSLWDVLLGGHRIVDLRSGDTVFYDLETEITRSKTGRLVLGIMLLPIGLLWIADTAFLLLGYGVVNLRSKPKNHSKKHP